MARRDSVAALKTRRQSPKLPNQGKQPQGIKKEHHICSPRRSARLSRSIKVDKALDGISQNPFPSPESDIKGVDSSQRVLQSKRTKRKRETEQLSLSSPKRPRASCLKSPVQTTSTRKAVNFPRHDVDSITYWAQTSHWPQEYFDESGEMSHLLARKKSTTSLRRKRSDAGSGEPSSNTPSDQKPREEKSAPYQDPRYRSLLEAKGSFMGKYVGRNEEGPIAESKKEYKSFLETEQLVPEHSLFQDDFFEETCEMIQDRNEAKVIQDIARLIVPSAQSLAVRGAKHLRWLIESVNEGWNNSIPITKPRPQPDYSVGFKRSAFTEDQLRKLQPFVGELTDSSFFMGTWYMYFPFFSSEVKCGAAALDVADRQNAHSMTLAVRGVVELFRLMKREKELHREILAFSISHDNETVRIYGHYPVIEERKTTFYRHPVHKFSFTALDGKEKWTAYQFTKNIYDVWMPVHFKRLCSVIDAIPPDIHFELSEESELQFPPSSGLSQGMESHHLSESVATDDDALRLLDSQEVTSDTSITQESEQVNFKKPKKR